MSSLSRRQPEQRAGHDGTHGVHPPSFSDLWPGESCTARRSIGLQVVVVYPRLTLYLQVVVVYPRLTARDSA
ncbi:hypothetical protein RRG08_019792 [Elysia crispata]|uniref:Uncharacterized protein n=1 Tax=Elysia crispata TaxID=231223 RepID=A0AAE1AY48_9GAST|nr:hypothetical protein RRG08_019792 [Elysia crispata]